MLIDLGICRTMTSGQQRTALAGASQIATLVWLAAGRIEVLPAGGINGDNVATLLEQTGCDQVHGGLRGSGRDASALSRPDLDFSTPPLPPDLYELTDGSLVSRLRHAIDTHGNG